MGNSGARVVLRPENQAILDEGILINVYSSGEKSS